MQSKQILFSFETQIGSKLVPFPAQSCPCNFLCYKISNFSNLDILIYIILDHIDADMLFFYNRGVVRMLRKRFSPFGHEAVNYLELLFIKTLLFVCSLILLLNFLFENIIIFDFTKDI